MKKRHAAMAAALITALTAAWLSACTTWWGDTVLEGAFGFVTGRGKNAMVYEYRWDGDEENMAIVIPKTCGEDYTVTAMGGYLGRGFPMPFCIYVPFESDYAFDPVYNSDYDELTSYGWWSGYTVIRYDFTLYIGTNITSVDYVDQSAFVRLDEEDFATIYEVRVYIVCDSENKNYYSEDGRLYQRDGTPVEGFLYTKT